MNILFVDDSKAILDEMKEIIQETGHKIVTAKDGAEGLAELALQNLTGL